MSDDAPAASATASATPPMTTTSATISATTMTPEERRRQRRQQRIQGDGQNRLDRITGLLYKDFPGAPDAHGGGLTGKAADDDMAVEATPPATATAPVTTTADDAVATTITTTAMTTTATVTRPTAPAPESLSATPKPVVVAAPTTVAPAVSASASASASASFPSLAGAGIPAAAAVTTASSASALSMMDALLDADDGQAPPHGLPLSLGPSLDALSSSSSNPRPTPPREPLDLWQVVHVWLMVLLALACSAWIVLQTVTDAAVPEQPLHSDDGDHGQPNDGHAWQSVAMRYAHAWKMAAWLLFDSARVRNATAIALRQQLWSESATSSSSSFSPYSPYASSSSSSSSDDEVFLPSSTTVSGRKPSVRSMRSHCASFHLGSPSCTHS